MIGKAAVEPIVAFVFLNAIVDISVHCSDMHAEAMIFDFNKRFSNGRIYSPA